MEDFDSGEDEFSQEDIDLLKDTMIDINFLGKHREAFKLAQDRFDTRVLIDEPDRLDLAWDEEKREVYAEYLSEETISNKEPEDI